MAKVRLAEGTNGRQGCIFLCPGCKEPHYMTVRPHLAENGASWEFNGDVDSPTFSPSILQRIEYKSKPVSVCHSFVRNGEIEFLSDCTHPLAGQTIELPDITDDDLW